MTKGLADVFGLPSMDDILAETDEDAVELEQDEMMEAPAPSLPVRIDAQHPSDQMISTALAEVDDHGKAMDLIYADTLKHAIDSAELAFDLDPARAPRMLEVSNGLYGQALSAKNSKIEARMKMMKLMNETKKLSLDEQRMRHEMGSAPSDKADVIMVEDRNTLLKRLKEEAAAEKKA